MSETPTMTWDFVMESLILPLLEADTLLIEALGGLHIYQQSASRPIRVPSVVWDLLGDTLEELFNPIETQWDYFAHSMQDAAVIEGRLRLNLHRDAGRDINGVRLRTVYRDSFTHNYPDPGKVHRSLRFTFIPARRIVASIES